MDKLTVIWVVIGVYAVMMLAVGILQSRKNAGGMESFTVGGRSAGAWISALSYGTAYFSAVMFIGYSGGSGWSFGLWSVLGGVRHAARLARARGKDARAHAALADQVDAAAL